MLFVFDSLFYTLWVACSHAADSFFRAKEKGELVTLDNITSVAKSLGARRVSPTLMNWLGKSQGERIEVGNGSFSVPKGGHNGKLFAGRVKDASAVAACLQFANDERSKEGELWASRWAAIGFVKIARRGRR